LQQEDGLDRATPAALMQDPVRGLSVQLLSRAVFGFASLALMLLAVSLIVQGIYEPVAAFWRSGEEGKQAILGAIGVVIIAIAVFDVAKFIFEEEVIEPREKRDTAEARRSLTRFISTLVIAIFLEALITVFRVSSVRITEMLYPTALLVAGTLLMLGLGLYQRLSVTVEQEVGEEDRVEQE
jgi:hypothetical protein